MNNPFTPFRTFLQRVSTRQHARRHNARPSAAMISPVQRTEKLDDRVMLAGNTTVQLLGSTLRLTGDADANSITISFDAVAGNITVVENTGGTLNGGGAPLVFGIASVNFLRADMLAGNDFLQIFENNGNTSAVSLETLLVDMDEGADQFLVSEVDFNQFGTISGGSGNDFLQIFETDFGGDLRFIGNNGNDDLRVIQSRVGGTLRGRTNTGVDRLVVSRTEVLGETRLSGGTGSISAVVLGSKSQGKITVRGATSHDNLAVIGTLAGNGLTMSGLGGDDVLRLEDSAIQGDAQLVGGTGDNYFFVNGDDTAASTGGPAFVAVSGQLSLNGGTGNETFVFCNDNVLLGEDFRVRGETGTDIYFDDNSVFTPFGVVVQQNVTDQANTTNTDAAADTIIATLNATYFAAIGFNPFNSSLIKC